jgi:hypothetical protein
MSIVYCTRAVSRNARFLQGELRSPAERGRWRDIAYKPSSPAREDGRGRGDSRRFVFSLRELVHEPGSGLCFPADVPRELGRGTAEKRTRRTFPFCLGGGPGDSKFIFRPPQRIFCGVSYWQPTCCESEIIFWEHRDKAGFRTYLYVGDIACHNYGYIRIIVSGLEAEIRRHGGNAVPLSTNANCCWRMS